MSRSRAGGVGNLHNDFPYRSWNRHLIGNPIPGELGRTANDQDLVPVGCQPSGVGFKVGPKPLVVLRGLRGHIAHPERHFVIGHGGGPVRRRTHVATVPAFAKAAPKRGGSHAVITRRQSSFLRPRISSAAGTAIARGVAPTYPVGLMVDSVVGHRELRSGDQVVVCLGGVRGGGGWVAQGDLIIHPLLGPGRAGYSKKHSQQAYTPMQGLKTQSMP